MRVCLDMQSAVAQRAGVGRYTKLLAEHLAAARGKHTLCGFFFDFHRRGLSFHIPGAELASCRWLPGRVAQGLWKTVGLPPYDLLAGPADLYHFPNFTLPPLRRGRSAITVHDAAFARLPDTLEEKNLAYLRAHMGPSIARADAVLTPSRFTANELGELLQVPREKLFPVLSGIDPAMAPQPPARVNALRRRLGLDRPYLLMVGTLEPRKNIPFLFDVFDRLDGFDGDLVIAGRPGWKYEPILARLQSARRRDRIRLVEQLGEDELPDLYTGAELFVLASHYEGFGFPPLEAMACGTPAVVSPGGALAETCAGGGLVLPDTLVDAWVAALERLLSHPSEREALRARGLAHAATLTWPETARQTWKAYEAAGGG